MAQLPDDIVNRICCMAIKSRDAHPMSDEVKTLYMLNDVIKKYKSIYENEDEAMNWLIIDLDSYFFSDEENDWGVIRKWKSLSPSQRRFFNSLTPC